MNISRMCGVVLWSSDDDGRAVIWCEDHGNLAFYSGQTADMHEGPSLDAGDLIEFDLEDRHEHRRASNPKLLVEDHSPRIAVGLRNSAQAAAARPAHRPQPNVVSLPLPGDERSPEHYAIA